MRPTLTLKVTLRLATCVLAPAVLLGQSAVEMYQRALVQDQAAGNLQEAVSLYRRAATKAGEDRALAAKALVRAGTAEEKLGDPHAADTYALVVRTYTEQREPVAHAQARLAVLRPATAGSAGAGGAPGRPDLPSVVDVAIETYCVGCHNPRQRLGNLDFQTLRVEGLAANAVVWERALQRLRARRDPPAGLPRPDDDTYRAMVDSLAAALDRSYPANGAIDQASRIDDVGLANRMAAFLWGEEKPDGNLLEAARRGTLRSGDAIDRQVRRMLKDARASAFITGFLERWMLRDGLERLARTPSRVPGFDQDLLQDFATETRLFLGSQVQEDRDVSDLWTSNFTFVNERLARHYGLPGVTGAAFRRVTARAPERLGILGHASLLTATSFADRTSPVVRGVTVMRLFWGLNPPPPPPNVPPLASEGSGDRPMRERMNEATTVAVCRNCHRTFDQFGFALENFNAIGAWRTTQGGTPLDVSGVFPDGTRFNGPAELREGLLRTRDAFYASLTRSLLGYALGREGTAWRTYEHEMPAVRRVVRDAEAGHHRWSSLVAGIVRSAPFQRGTVVP